LSGNFTSVVFPRPDAPAKAVHWPFFYMKRQVLVYGRPIPYLKRTWLNAIFPSDPPVGLSNLLSVLSPLSTFASNPSFSAAATPARFDAYVVVLHGFRAPPMLMYRVFCDATIAKHADPQSFAANCR
jgi:hypothetical protein